MSSRVSSASGLAMFLGGAGVTHFVVPKFFDSIIPKRLPGSPRAWTYGSGVAELAVAAAIANPATRRTGALAAAALFVAVFPGNIKYANDSRGGSKVMQALAFGRLPMQIPMVVWALRVAQDTEAR